MQLETVLSEFSLANRATRVLWSFVWLFLFRPSPRLCFGWRRAILRLFGARVGQGARIHNSVRVFYPANLTIGDHVVVGPDVDLYCVAPITIQRNSMISQYAYLCAATHDYRQANLPLIALPITIGEETWICARAFVGPNVTIGRRVVVGACAVVIKSIADDLIVAGNPARTIRNRNEDGQLS